MLGDKEVVGVYAAGEMDVLRHVGNALDLMEIGQPARAYNALTKALYYMAMLATLKVMFTEGTEVDA